MPIQIVIQTRDNERGAYTTTEATTSDPEMVADTFNLIRRLTDTAEEAALPHGTPPEAAIEGDPVTPG